MSLHLGTRSGQTLAMRLRSAYALGSGLAYGLKGTCVPRSKGSCYLWDLTLLLLKLYSWLCGYGSTRPFLLTYLAPVGLSIGPWSWPSGLFPFGPFSPRSLAPGPPAVLGP